MRLTSAVYRAFCLAACFTQSVFQMALAASRPDIFSPTGDARTPPPDDPPLDYPASSGRSPASEESLLFGSGLIGTMLRQSTSLSVRPHFGDLLHEDYLSVTLALRYGLTDEWEASCAVDAYFGNGLGSQPLFSDPGLSRLQLGTRYQLTEEPEHPVGCAVGISYSRPVGRPPESLVDPNEHLFPYVIVSRKLVDHPGWTTFVRVGVDFVSLKILSAADEAEGLPSDSWLIAPGVNWERGDWSYTLTTSFASTAGLGSENDYRITVAPLVNWKIPSDWTPGRKGRWVLGLGFTAAFGTQEPDFGVRGSLRTDFNLRNLFRKKHPRQIRSLVVIKAPRVTPGQKPARPHGKAPPAARALTLRQRPAPSDGIPSSGKSRLAPTRSKPRKPPPPHAHRLET